MFSMVCGFLDIKKDRDFLCPGLVLEKNKKIFRYPLDISLNEWYYTITARETEQNLKGVHKNEKVRNRILRWRKQIL